LFKWIGPRACTIKRVCVILLAIMGAKSEYFALMTFWSYHYFKTWNPLLLLAALDL
jgi:hypothetical protein